MSYNDTFDIENLIKNEFYINEHSLRPSYESDFKNFSIIAMAIHHLKLYPKEDWHVYYLFPKNVEYIKEHFKEKYKDFYNTEDADFHLLSAYTKGIEYVEKAIYSIYFVEDTNNIIIKDFQGKLDDYYVKPIFINASKLKETLIESNPDIRNNVKVLDNIELQEILLKAFNDLNSKNYILKEESDVTKNVLKHIIYSCKTSLMNWIDKNIEEVRIPFTVLFIPIEIPYVHKRDVKRPGGLAILLSDSPNLVEIHEIFTKLLPKVNDMFFAYSYSAAIKVKNEIKTLKDQLILHLPPLIRDKWNTEDIDIAINNYKEATKPKPLENAVILFTDIRGFSKSLRSYTKLGNATEWMFKRLTEFRDEMVRIIVNNSGIPINFAGDDILALYSPSEEGISLRSKIEKCVQSAFQMRNQLEKLNENWIKTEKIIIKQRFSEKTPTDLDLDSDSWDKLFEKDFTWRIGTCISVSRKSKFPIHVGNIGGEHSNGMKQYTAISDSINLAARGAAEAIGGEILLHGSVLEALSYSNVADLTWLPEIAMGEIKVLIKLLTRLRLKDIDKREQRESYFSVELKI